MWHWCIYHGSLFLEQELESREEDAIVQGNVACLVKRSSHLTLLLFASFLGKCKCSSLSWHFLMDLCLFSENGSSLRTR